MDSFSAVRSIRGVTERYYRGIPVSPEILEATLAVHAARKDEILRLWSTAALLDDGRDRDEPAKFLHAFSRSSRIRRPCARHPGTGHTRVRAGHAAAARTQGISIRSSEGRPDDAYVAVAYHDKWFGIDDRDLRTKRAFATIMLLFTLRSFQSLDLTLFVDT